jgi:predicted transposase/invertase (TIGR01784 family)
LIYQSIHSPERPVLNTQNEGIKKAMELISFENLTPEERAKAKNKEAAKIVLAKTEQQAKLKIAKNLLKSSLSNEEIANYTGLTIKQIEQLRNEKD